MKKYFDTPRMTLVSMTADVIATSVIINGETGNASTGGVLAPDRRRSIWD